MQFLYPALTWGFLIALLPLLIHLINMMRHRRVHWAAMDFLLQSYKKHRKWVWLKQLILLLMRMAAIALAVAMLAQWITGSQLLDILGGKATHHYVLIDDSLSMSDRVGGTTAFDSALRFVQRLGSEASRQELRQKFTLLRFSRAAVGEDSEQDEQNLAGMADFNAATVDADFGMRLEQQRNVMHATQLAIGPRPALETVRQLVAGAADEKRVLYLVSDFRAGQWDNPSQLRQVLRDLEEAGVEIHLVPCVRSVHPNLAITRLEPTEDTRAADVPLFLYVSVWNTGSTAAQRVQLKVRSIFHDPAVMADDAPVRPTGQVEELPIVEIDRIEPGQTVRQRVQVHFGKAGRHVVHAQLPEDSVAADNQSWCVIDFPEGEPVLLVDGDPDRLNAFYMQAIFDPGQRARTGIRAEQQTAAFLRDTSLEVLKQYTAIYLFDVHQLDDSAIRNLQAYVAAGGGLGLFVGPQVDANVEFYNEKLYRLPLTPGTGQPAGQTSDELPGGLLPLPLDHAYELSEQILNKVPDVETEGIDHPVFRELAAGINPILRSVRILFAMGPPEGWQPPPQSTVRVLARLRNGKPLAVEHQFGQGRVIVFLTTYGPSWNNLVRTPNALLALRLQSYLASQLRTLERHRVGDPLRLDLRADRFRREVKIFAPGQDPATPRVIQQPAVGQGSAPSVLTATLAAREVIRSGVYEAWATTSDGKVEAFRYAVNVDNSESDLKTANTRRMLEQLDPVQPTIHFADQYEASSIEQTGFNRSLLILCLLVGLLLVEQVMAYLCSYHPARGAAS